MGLAGGDNYASFDLNLREGESVTNLTRVDVRLEADCFAALY